jgi:hypothetical protein
LKDTGASAPMKIMMAGSQEDICLFAYSPQSPGDTWQLRSCTAPEGGCRSPSDTWRPWSCPEPLGHVAVLVLSRAAGTPSGLGAALSREAGAILDLELVRGDTWSSGYQQIAYCLLMN